MSVSNYTNEVMKALPSALRPNPFYIDEYVNKAMTLGWTPTKLAETSFMNKPNMTPGLVATNIKNLSQYPPHTQKPTFTTKGHQPCKHHQTCQLCYCDPTQPAKHHVTSPMPEWFKKALDNGGTDKAFKTELHALGIDTDHLTHLQNNNNPKATDDYLNQTLNKQPNTTTHYHYTNPTQLSA